MSLSSIHRRKTLLQLHTLSLDTGLALTAPWVERGDGQGGGLLGGGGPPWAQAKVGFAAVSDGGMVVVAAGQRGGQGGYGVDLACHGRFIDGP